MRLWLALSGALALAACADPMATVPRLADQDIPEDNSTLSALPTNEKAEPRTGGFFAALLGGGENVQDTPDEAPPQAVSEEGALPEDGTEPQTVVTASQQPDAAAEAPAAQKRRGLFGLFAAAGRNTTPGAIDVAVEPDKAQDIAGDAGDDGQVQLAALDAEPTKPSRGRGLFGAVGGGGTSARADTADVRDIAPGMVLPYGQVGRVCGLPKGQMGKKIAGFPERRPTYALYDSQPGNTAAHTFYLTGFADGCARQFTASLAVFGSVGMHEQLRYGLPAEVQPYSDTDKAYEALKSRVCNVPRRKPCGAKIGRLENDTVFVSVYERFGSNAQWKNLLLHDGAVLALDRKGG